LAAVLTVSKDASTAYVSNSQEDNVSVVDLRTRKVRVTMVVCEANGIVEFDLAFCYEALARAHAVAGDTDEALRWQQRGVEAAKDVFEDEDRELLVADLASVPF